MSSIGEIQRSQLITTYGIGSIYDARDYSVIIACQDDWEIKNTEIIYEERLQKKLGKEYFRQPGVIENIPTIPSYRFPEWVFCPKCKSLRHIRKLNERKQKKCAICKVNYVPARFIIACENGHLSDFPWEWWVHEGEICETPKLKIHTTGSTTSLAGISVSCENCPASRTLEGIFGRYALKGFKCFGKKPWMGPYEKGEECSESPRVLQRGSASVYYSQTESAISIPPYSERIHDFLRQFDDDLEYIPENLLEKWLEGKMEKTGERFDMEALLKAVKFRKDPDKNKNQHDSDLRQAEYEALCNPGKMDPANEFAAEQGSVPIMYKEQISKIVLVHRLREVKVLTGFNRIIPDNGKTAPISKKEQNWLPAAEMKGEGIFIELASRSMEKWVSNCSSQISNRIKKLEKNRQTLLEHNKVWTVEHTVTPQFLILHTLAHILIQQLILDCGYSSSSLRERLYYSDGRKGQKKMNGFLIYTATSDSEGSLGGLVRQGELSRFTAVLNKSFENARWCSSDPLCIESEGQGNNSLNLAACHSCCLLPETSCEYRNSYLDRGVVVGLGDASTQGFFPEIL